MTNSRYNRWQGLAIAQFSVAVALITAFSAAALGVGLSLLQNKEFPLSPSLHYLFAGSLLLLLCAIFLSCGTVVTRTLDFRLTARKVRKDTSAGHPNSLTIFGVGPDVTAVLRGGCFGVVVSPSSLVSSCLLSVSEMRMRLAFSKLGARSSTGPARKSRTAG